jgi:hypothetical protein
MMWRLEKKQRVIGILCLIYGIWHFGTNWTTTLLSFLQWDTTDVLSIVDLAYIQGGNWEISEKTTNEMAFSPTAFGSLCNAIGSLAIGQVKIIN